jgi:hypothetical protein
MAGIILGALGGAGAAAQEAGSTMMKSDLDTERQLAVQKQGSDLELQRQEALEDFKTAHANVQRQAMVARIKGAAENIADTQMAPLQATEQAGIVNRETWTPEQQAAMDQSNTLTRTGIVNKALKNGDAAIQTGDISPTEAAKLANSSEINQMKLDSLLQRAEDRNQTMKEVADVRAEAMRYGYELRLQAAQERKMNGKVDTATSRMLITSEDANIRAATSQLNMLNTQLSSMSPTQGGKPNPAYQTLASQMDSLRTDISESKARKIDLFKSLGIVSDSPAAPSPAPAVPTPGAPAAPASRPPLGAFLK